MLIDFEPGDYVKNPAKKDWGVGQVQSIIGKKVTVNFENSGKKVINIENINLISVDEMNFKAKRPNGMMMDVSKFEKSFKINLPTLSSEIELFNSTKGHEI